MRNPYHNYTDLLKIEDEGNEIIYQLKNHQLEVPYKLGFSIYEEYWYLKDNGFNICYSKEDFKNKNILSFPSKKWYGEIITYPHKELGKLRKNGKPYKRKKGNPIFNERTNEWVYEYGKGKYEYISTDIQSFLEVCRDYRQISCGLTHNERQIVVCDFDEDYTDTSVERLEKICLDHNIPHFTYLERHLDSNHYQIGWILNKPFDWSGYSKIEHTLYNRIVKDLSTLMGSDKGFKGWWIKNPNCINLTETQWFNDCVDKDEFVTSMKGVCYELEKQNITTTKQTDKKDITFSHKEGRNNYLTDTLRNWVWDYRRTHNDFPSFNETLTEGDRISTEIGKDSSKGKLPHNEIYSTVQSVYNFCKKNYHPYSNEDTKHNSEFGNIVKKTHKERNVLDICELKYGGLSNKEISKKIGKTEQTVCNLLKSGFLIGEDTTDLIRDSQRLLFYFYFNEKKSMKINSYIKDLEDTIDKFYKLSKNY